MYREVRHPPGRPEAGPEACPECLVPKEIMQAHFESALRASLIDLPQIKLIYPADV